MTAATTSKPPLTKALAIGTVLLLLTAAAIWWALSGTSERRVTAYFSSAVGIYPGGEVRVLGVPVGKVDAVTPNGDDVKVTMSVQRDVEIPSDARAVLMSPTVVSDRYVQLAPAYQGGPKMADNAVIPKERTATPVELDEVYRSLDKLTKALGPQGANRDGALTDLLNTSADNLDGNGQAMADLLRDLGKAGTTLSGNSEELFATVDQLEKFTGMLAANDDRVRQFNTQMEDVAALLADERQNLSAALAELAVALGKVESFVRDNREHVKSNVDQLSVVAKTLVKQKAALSESLRVAPLALGNLQNVYNAASGTLDTRANFNELNQPPLVGVCKLVDQTNPVELPVGLADACKQLQPVLDGVLPLPTLAETLSSVQQGKLPPLPLPLMPSEGGGQ